jgi:hypothetical protein
MPRVSIPVIKRPEFWVFIMALVQFLAIYLLEGRIDGNLLLTVLLAFLALIGIGTGIMVLYRVLQEPVGSQHHDQ